MPFATLAAALVLSPRFDFYPHGPYDSRVPRPESMLGYAPGDIHTTYRDQERVVNAMVAAAPDRARIIPYGMSPERRPLRVVAISSPRNIARLEQIRQEQQKLSRGEGDASKTIPIVWINQTIHGNETASFESAMWTLYSLIASRGELAKSLDKVVVILNPVYNPDGHERYVVYNNSIAVGSPAPQAFERQEPATVAGRSNRYRFDMNRDRVAFSQDETRQEFAEMLRWNPQVYVDQHDAVESYFFPPEPMSVNQNVDRARNTKWKGYFGRETAKAFDAVGASYYVGANFDLYFPGYVDASTTLTGAVGMTHETDGARHLARERPDGSVLTLKQGMHKHFLSAIAVVQAAAGRPDELLADYAKFKRNAVTGAHAGKFQAVVMQGDDPRALARLQRQLSYAGIESRLTKASFRSQMANDYWTGVRAPKDFTGFSLVVPMAQPQGAFAKALMEPGVNFEKEFIERQLKRLKSAPEGEQFPGPDSPEFYDTTGWAIPYAHSLQAWWCEEPISLQALEPWSDSRAPRLAESPIGYAMRYRDQEDILAVAEALMAGVRGMITTEAMTTSDGSFPAGTFLFLRERNEDGYEQKLFDQATKRGSVLTPLRSAFPTSGSESPGSESVLTLRKPSIGVVMGSGASMADSGAIWWLMEREFRLPFTPLSSAALSGDLSRYTSLVLPGGVPGGSRLREWLSQGNGAVVLGSAGWALGSSNFVEMKSISDVTDLPGALFRAKLDDRSRLSYGYGRTEMAVPMSGGAFYSRRTEGGSILTLPSEKTAVNVLTGWTWPDNTEEKLRGAAVVQEVPVGRGRLTLFLQDPTERAMYPGLYRMLLNAMILGSAG